MRLVRSVPLAAALVFAGAAPAAAADGFMSLQDFQFAPATAEIRSGDKVDFNFEGPSRHRVKLRAGQTDRYDSGLTGPGFTKNHRFRHPGRFALYCSVHLTMTARVQVGASEMLRPRMMDVKATPGTGKVRMSFRLSERAVIRLVVGGKRVRKVFGSGMRSITIANLDPGRHTATLEARDGWANKSSIAKRSFRVR